MLAVRGFRGLAGRSFSWLPARDIASPVARCSGAATPDYIFDADETNFEALVLKAAKPVIVQMHATWCGPCQMLKPWLDEVVREMDGKVGARERGGEGHDAGHAQLHRPPLTPSDRRSCWPEWTWTSAPTSLKPSGLPGTRCGAGAMRH